MKHYSLEFWSNTNSFLLRYLRQSISTTATGNGTKAPSYIMFVISSVEKLGQRKIHRNVDREWKPDDSNIQ